MYNKTYNKEVFWKINFILSPSRRAVKKMAKKRKTIKQVHAPIRNNGPGPKWDIFFPRIGYARHPKQRGRMLIGNTIRPKEKSS